MRIFLLTIAFICTPIFWAAFNISGARVGFLYMYRDLFRFYQSDEPFGIFDGMDK